MSEPPPREIAARIRNRIMEYLSLAGSFAEQLRYQRRVPAVHVPHEVVNQWEDWVPDTHPRHFPLGVYTPAEQAAIRTFHSTWRDVTGSSPDPLPPLEVLQQHPQWQRLREAALAAHRVFAVRGSLPEAP